MPPPPPLVVLPLTVLLVRVRAPRFQMPPLPCPPLELLLTVLLVPPAGDFPLNDDWIYAQAVQGILEDGHFSGHPYSTALLGVQAYWGALFCAVFGFCFVVLRCSTLLLWLAVGWWWARCAWRWSGRARPVDGG